MMNSARLKRRHEYERSAKGVAASRRSRKQAAHRRRHPVDIGITEDAAAYVVGSAVASVLPAMSQHEPRSKTRRWIGRMVNLLRRRQSR